MALTDRQLDLIRQSFSALRDDPEPKSVTFYEALFKYDPSLKEMFREDIANQGMKFMSTLRVIVDNLHNPAAMATRYTDLGEGHRAMGVRAPDFEPMGRALIDTIADAMGDDFTDEMRQAWEVAYAEFSSDIIDRGHIPKK